MVYAMTDFFFNKHITSAHPEREPTAVQSDDCTNTQFGEPVSFSLGLQTRVWWEVAHTEQDDFEAAGSLKSPPQLK